MNTDVIIFTGPSLSPEHAQQLFPEACIHAPVRCGDIIKVLRLHPKTIVIIDGFFEQTAAVWHKEILLALSLGVSVYGASSMGALRAAEMHRFGMIGHGQIFEWYRDGVIIDEDEVALTHNQEGFESPLTPMVNVRATLSSVLQKGLISSAQADDLIQTLKTQPYYQRSLFRSIGHLPQLQSVLDKEYINQKQQDAIALLNQLRQQALPKSLQPDMVGTIFFNKIFREMIIEPFERPYSWLPHTEQRYADLQNHPAFSAIKRAGKLLHAVHDLLQAQNINLEPAAIIDWVKQQKPLQPIERLLKHVLIYHDVYPAEQHPEVASINLLLTQLLNGLMRLLKQRRYKLQVYKIVDFANEFRRQRNLLSIEDTLAWLKKNDLNGQADFQAFVKDTALLYYFADQHQTGLTGVKTDLTITPWGMIITEVLGLS